MEGEVKTLLLGGSTKKIKCRWEGGECGRKNEDFITGKEPKIFFKCRWEGGEWKEK